MEARIAIDGRDTDAESLWDWLCHEPKLCWTTADQQRHSPEGAMSATTELVVQAAARAGACVMIALVRSLSVRLVQRLSNLTMSLSNLTMKVTGPDGWQVSVSARQVGAPEQLLRAALEPATPKPVREAPPPNPASEAHSG